MRPVVIDPEFPWKLPQASYSPNWWSYKNSISEWKDLLVRAKRGDPAAEWEVADRFSDGCRDEHGKVVVRRSPSKAAEWFRRSAEHGNTDAYLNLGNILGDGDGVEKNVPEALLWLRRAFRAGNTGTAANNIAITYRENGNFKLAVRWFRRCVASGDDGALIDLGIHYYWGKGVRKNSKSAVRCFRKATKGKNISEAERDNAFFYLGVAYLEGKGVKRSIPTAWKSFVRANADDDHPAALNMLQQLGQHKNTA